MNTRSPRIATEPYPAPSWDADHTSAGPDLGHCLRSPISFDTPFLSGPRHCGQSVDGDWALRETKPGVAAATSNNSVLLNLLPNFDLSTLDFQKPTPALTPNVLGLPISPMKPDGASAPYAKAIGM